MQILYVVLGFLMMGILPFFIVKRETADCDVLPSNVVRASERKRL
jgi:hypothetical protein